MTGPVPQPADREALAAAIQEQLDADITTDGRVAFREHFGERAASAILTQWRLVPVETDGDVHPAYKYFGEA